MIFANVIAYPQAELDFTPGPTDGEVCHEEHAFMLIQTGSPFRYLVESIGSDVQLGT